MVGQRRNTEGARLVVPLSSWTGTENKKIKISDWCCGVLFLICRATGTQDEYKGTGTMMERRKGAQSRIRGSYGMAFPHSRSPPPPGAPRFASTEKEMKQEFEMSPPDCCVSSSGTSLTLKIKPENDSARFYGSLRVCVLVCMLVLPFTQTSFLCPLPGDSRTKKK